MIELKHLRLLKAISDLGTLSGAARELGYSQPAASQQIHTLERHLRTAVLIRTRSGARLTEAGSVLLRHGLNALASVSLAETEIEAIVGQRSGRVRVSGFPSAAAAIISTAFGRVAKSAPGLQLAFVEGDPQTSLALLRSGECEIAVVYEYVVSGNVTHPLALEAGELQIPLVSESLNIVVPYDHPEAGREHASIARLSKARWIAGCSSCKENLKDVCGLAGFEPEIAFETDDYVALQALVAAGLGIALVTDLMLMAARREPGLALRPVWPRCRRKVSLVTTAQLLKVPGIEVVITALGESASGAAVDITALEESASGAAVDLAIRL